MFGLNEDTDLEVIASAWVVVVEDRNMNEVIQRVYFRRSRWSPTGRGASQFKWEVEKQEK